MWSIRLGVIGVVAAVLLTAILGDSAAMAARAVRCDRDAGVVCSRVAVPLDRAAPDGPAIDLFVQRLRAPEPKGVPVLALAGGPGESATARARAFRLALGPGLTRQRDMVLFDARGTGRSGTLLCSELQADTSLTSGAAAEACAQLLDSSRAHFTTADQVEDIEAVRAALDVNRFAILGVSAGTAVALAYANRYPDRVERLILDSPVASNDPVDAAVLTMTALRRALKGALADLRAVVRRLQQHPLRGISFDRAGRRRRTSMDEPKLLEVLLESDRNQVLRAALPAALAAARRRDPAPISRLAALLDGLRLRPPAARTFSAAMHAATLCEQLDLPWDPAASAAERQVQAAARLRAVPAAALAPFAPETLLTIGPLSLCQRWPEPIALRSEFPPASAQVPTLLLSGRVDLRTPAEGAAILARSSPTTILLRAVGVGHSVLATARTGCASKAAKAFLAGRAVRRRCPAAAKEVPSPAVPPRSLADVVPIPGVPERVGRTLKAADLTLRDVRLALALDPRRRAGGGLRGGRFARGRRGVVLARYQFVPGVRIGARPRRDGACALTVRGRAATPGRLLLQRSGIVSGRLGGVRVRTRFRAGPPR